jgi:hypothetical protein
LGDHCCGGGKSHGKQCTFQERLTIHGKRLLVNALRL